jgi:hypothetical protein
MKYFLCLQLYLDTSQTSWGTASTNSSSQEPVYQRTPQPSVVDIGKGKYQITSVGGGDKYSLIGIYLIEDCYHHPLTFLNIE